MGKGRCSYSGKKQYYSHKHAFKVARFLNGKLQENPETRGVRLTYYRCKGCHLLHHTSQTQKQGIFADDVTKAKSESSTADELKQFAVSKDVEVRRALASNIKTPPTSLIRLTKDPDRRTRKLALYNPATPIKFLVQIVLSDNEEAQTYAANNPTYRAAADEAEETITLTNPDYWSYDKSNQQKIIAQTLNEKKL